MNSGDLAQVGFRILAVYIGVASIPAIGSFGTILNDPALSGGVFSAGLVMLLVPIAIAILLWGLAPRLAVFAAGEGAAEDSESRIGPRDLTRSGLIIVGAYFFASSFPALLAQLIALMDEQSATRALYIVQLAISCILGVALVLGAERIALLVQKVRYAGQSG